MAFGHVAEIYLKQWRENMWSAVNLLPNSAKISDLINRDVFHLKVC